MRTRIVRTQDGKRITDTIDFPDANELAYAALGRIVFSGLADGESVTVERLTELGGMPAISPDEPQCPDIGGRELVPSLPRVAARL